MPPFAPPPPSLPPLAELTLLGGLASNVAQQLLVTSGRSDEASFYRLANGDPISDIYQFGNGGNYSAGHVIAGATTIYTVARSPSLEARCTGGSSDGCRSESTPKPPSEPQTSHARLRQLAASAARRLTP